MLTRLDKGEDGKRLKEKSAIRQKMTVQVQSWRLANRDPSAALSFSLSPFPFYPLHLFRFFGQSGWVFLRGKCFHLGSRVNQPGSQDEYG